MVYNGLLNDGDLKFGRAWVDHLGAFMFQDVVVTIRADRCKPSVFAVALLEIVKIFPSPPDPMMRLFVIQIQHL